MSYLDTRFQKPGEVLDKTLADALLTGIKAVGEVCTGDQYREEGLDESAIYGISSLPVRLVKTGPVTLVGISAYSTLVITTPVRTTGFVVAANQVMVIRAQFQCPNTVANQGIPGGAVVSARLAYSIAGVPTNLTLATERQHVGDSAANIFTMDTVLLPATYDWIEIQESRSAGGNYNFWNASIFGELLHRTA